MKAFELQFLIGMLVGSVFTSIFIRPFFLKKIRLLKEQSNRNLERFLINFNVGKYIENNSLINSLCLLRREYVKNNTHSNGEVGFFDQYILDRLGDFIDLQTDGIAFFLELFKNVHYVDPEVAVLIKEAVKLRKDKVIELFEKSYLSYQNATEQWKLTFRHAIKHACLADAELAYIFYDRLKQDGVLIFEESVG
jgi:hypothetical protein